MLAVLFHLAWTPEANAQVAITDLDQDLPITTDISTSGADATAVSINGVIGSPIVTNSAKIATDDADALSIVTSNNNQDDALRIINTGDISAGCMASGTCGRRGVFIDDLMNPTIDNQGMIQSDGSAIVINREYDSYEERIEITNRTGALIEGDLDGDGGESTIVIDTTNSNDDGTARIFNENGGVIRSDNTAIDFDGRGNFQVINAGTLQGDVSFEDLVGGSFNNEFVNRGTFTGDLFQTTSDGIDMEIVNEEGGTIIGNIAEVRGGEFSFIGLVNDGSITGFVGVNQLTNTGTIDGDIRLNFNRFNSGFDNANSGTITGNIAGGSNSVFVNSGQITGDFSLITGLDLDNTGTIDGSFSVADDSGFSDRRSSEILNSGTITGNITTGSADDFYRNTGTVGGTVDLGAGRDTFVALSGSANGTQAGVDGGAGADLIVYDVAAGETRTFNSLADALAPVAGITGFETVGKLGDGTLVLDFNTPTTLTDTLLASGGTLRLASDFVLNPTTGPALDGIDFDDPSNIENAGTLTLGADLLDEFEEIALFHNTSSGIVNLTDVNGTRLNVNSRSFSFRNGIGEVRNDGVVNGSVQAFLVTNSGDIQYTPTSSFSFDEAVDLIPMNPDFVPQARGLTNSGTILVTGSVSSVDAVSYFDDEVFDFRGTALLSNEGLIETQSTFGYGVDATRNILTIDNFDDGIIRGVQGGIRVTKSASDKYDRGCCGGEFIPGTLSITNRDSARIASANKAIEIELFEGSTSEIDVDRILITNEAGATIQGDTDAVGSGDYAIGSNSDVVFELSNAGDILGGISLNFLSAASQNRTGAPFGVEISNTGLISDFLDTGQQNDLLSNRGVIGGVASLEAGDDSFVEWVTGANGSQTNVDGGNGTDFWLFGIDAGQSFTFTEASAFVAPLQGGYVIANESFEGVGTAGGGDAVLAFTGTPTITAPIRIAGNSLTIANDLILQPTTGDALEFLNSGQAFTNQATVTANADILLTNSGQTLTNAVGGTLTLQNGAGLYFEEAESQTLINVGTISGPIEATVEDGTSGGLIVQNSGTINYDVTSTGAFATLSLFGGGTLTNDNMITTSGTTRSGASAVFIQRERDIASFTSTVVNRGTIAGNSTDGRGIQVSINDWEVEISNENLGVISGTGAGIFHVGGEDSDFLVENKSGGTIESEGDAIFTAVPVNERGFYDVTIRNFAGATISGDIDNSGAGAALNLMIPSALVVENDGTINGDIIITENETGFQEPSSRANSYLLNTGEINGDITGSAFSDFVSNRAAVNGDIDLGGADDFWVFWRTGDNGTQTSVTGGDGDDVLLTGVDAGESITITSLADFITPIGAPSGFERGGFNGEGTLILNFTEETNPVTLDGLSSFGDGTLIIESDVRMTDNLQINGDQIDFDRRRGEGGTLINRANITLTAADRFSGDDRVADIGLAHEGVFINEATGVVDAEMVAVEFCSGCSLGAEVGSLNFSNGGDQTVDNRGTINTYIDFLFSDQTAFDDPTSAQGDRLINSGDIIHDPQAVLTAFLNDPNFPGGDFDINDASGQRNVVEYNEIGSLLNSGRIINRDPNADYGVHFSRNVNPAFGVVNTSTGLIETARGNALNIEGFGIPFEGIVWPTIVTNGGTITSLDGTGLFIEDGDGVTLTNEAGGVISGAGPDTYTSESFVAGVVIEDQRGRGDERTDITINNAGTITGPNGVYLNDVNEDIVIANSGRIEATSTSGFETENGAAIFLVDFDGPSTSSGTSTESCASRIGSSTDAHCFVRIENNAGGEIVAGGTAIDYDAESDSNDFVLDITNAADATIRGDTNGDGTGLAIRVRRSVSSSTGATFTTLTNDGTIEGDIDLFNGDDVVSNTGTITGDVLLGLGDDSFTLSATGTQTGSVLGGGGSDSLLINVGANMTRSILATDFGGFETVNLNPAAESVGRFVVDSDADTPVFAADGGGLSLVTLSNGILAGNGAIGGSLSVASTATIAPGSSIGTLQVLGDYTQSGTYELEFRAPLDLGNIRADGVLWGRNTLDDVGLPVTAQDADLLAVSGSTDLLAGTILITPLSDAASYETALATAGNTAGELRYLVLRADGGFGNQQFAALSSDDDVGIDVVNGTDLVLVVTGGPGGIPGDPGSGPGGPGGTPGDPGSGPEGPGSGPGGPIEIDFITSAPPVVPLDASDWSRPGCNINLGQTTAGGRCAFSGLRFRTGSVDNDRTLNVLGGARDEDLDTITGQAGMGWDVSQGSNGMLWVGVAVEAGRSDYALNSGLGEADDDRFDLSVWAQYLDGTLDLRGWVTARYSDIGSTRFTDRGDALNSDQDAWGLGIQSEARYWYDLGDGMEVTPLLRLAAGRLWRDGFAETGSGNQLFVAEDDTQDSFRTTLGAEMRWRTTMFDGPALITASLGWTHEFGDTSAALSGFYAADGSRTRFTDTSLDRGRDFFDVGLSAALALSETESFSVSYSGSINNRFEDHQIGVQYSVFFD